MYKKLLCAVIAAVLILSCVPTAFAESFDLSNPAQVAAYVQRQSPGRMSVGPAVLTRDGKSEAVYLITLVGTGWTLTHYNNPIAYLCSTVSVSTSYLRAARRAAVDNIPAGSKVLIAGHSLGGTTAQQLAADKTMRDRFEIVNTLACGSPYVAVAKREGSLHRVAYTNDPIPTVSTNFLFNVTTHVSFENSLRPFDPYHTHSIGYMDEAPWLGYDAFGVKGGNAVITVNNSAAAGYNLEFGT